MRTVKTGGLTLHMKNLKARPFLVTIGDIEVITYRDKNGHYRINIKADSDVNIDKEFGEYIDIDGERVFLFEKDKGEEDEKA